MKTQQHFLLRIFADEAALDRGNRVFEQVIQRARVAKLLGATVQRTQGGFGHSTFVNRHNILEQNYPVIVEIIDVEPRVRAFWTSIAHLSGIGLVTLECIEVLHGGRIGSPPDVQARLRSVA